MSSSDEGEFISPIKRNKNGKVSIIKTIITFMFYMKSLFSKYVFVKINTKYFVKIKYFIVILII